jgi:hypothetical protein
MDDDIMLVYDIVVTNISRLYVVLKPFAKPYNDI